MDKYKKAYLLLFNRITDAIEAIENSDVELAREILISAQQKAEEIHIG